MFNIRRLPENLVNQIAAGEVIERPAAVVKELVENSIDAGAKNIQITLRDGGRSMISIKDDGIGMNKETLAIAVDRHVTSKLPDDDLVNISTLGFRGEALPSIGAISRMRISSKQEQSEAIAINIEGGNKSEIEPTSLTNGTKIEIRDLFYATPARLKFLKTPRTEAMHIKETIKRLAMAYPDVAFNIINDTKKSLALAQANGDLLDSRLERLGAIMGKEFTQNAMMIDGEREGITISGYAGLPTLNKGTAKHQYLFVNGRPVKDRLLIGAIRAAYADFLARDRHPMLCLFLNIPYSEIDINVHPAKTEVRFRDSRLVRGLIISALRHALSESGHRASTSVADQTLAKIRPEWDGEYRQNPDPHKNSKGMEGLEYLGSHYGQGNYSQSEMPDFNAAPMARYDYQDIPQDHVPQEYINPEEYPLGAARAQLHETYIISQTKDGFIITDQHAAHERLVYEKMKKDLEQTGVTRQALLIPDIVELEESSIERLIKYKTEFAELGLIIEEFGPNALAVHETPAMLGHVNSDRLLNDLADDLVNYGETLSLKEKLEEVCSTMACHGSIRAGRIMRIDEMNSLLRQMENTPYSGQCNHGRPTYVELKLNDIERLFGRR